MNIDALKAQLAARREQPAANADPTYQFDSEANATLDLLDAMAAVIEAQEQRIAALESR